MDHSYGCKSPFSDTSYFSERFIFSPSKLVSQGGRDDRLPRFWYEDDGGGKLPDDLKELLDVDTNMTSDDLMKEFSDNLDIPLMDDLGTSQLIEPWHFSDSSDSGLDCGMSIKEEPLSPSSSDVSEHSIDTYNQMSLDDTLQGLVIPDDVKLESPLGTQDILGESMALASVPMDTIDSMDFMTTTDSTQLSLGVPMVTVSSGVQQQPQRQKVTVNSNLTQVLNSKVKIKPKPLAPVAQTSLPNSQVLSPTALPAGSGKPLVLTAEEFAKLTSQGVLKIQSSASSTSTPVVSAKPIVSPSATQVKTIMAPINTAPSAHIDSKALKRQQRMIKNRESACLSRKRKKEYLATMEDRIRQYLQENEKLKQVNSQLKKKVELLETENQRLKGGAFNPNAKKASILLGVMLLFAVNFFPMASLLNDNRAQPANAPTGLIHHGRTLMSVKEEVSQPSISPSRPLPADPYTIIRETLRRGGIRKDLIARKALEEYTIPISMCPSYFNSTESSRLMDELNGWVQGHKTERKKKREQKEQQDKEDKKQEIEKRLKRQRKLQRNRKQQANNSPPTPRDVTENSVSEGRFEIQLFNGADANYQQLFDAIHRRNDTFYVVSFRRDHLLLPATAHNKTMRPRMSLVMPAVNLNDSINSGPGSVSMMQIDCEVMDTRLVYVAQSAVPLEMRERQNTTQKDWPKPPPSWPHAGSTRHVPRH